MDKDPETNADEAAKKKAEARSALLVGLIFGGLIVVLIAGMLAFSIYTERREGGTPPDSAHAVGG